MSKSFAGTVVSRMLSLVLLATSGVAQERDTGDRRDETVEQAQAERERARKRGQAGDLPGYHAGLRRSMKLYDQAGAVDEAAVVAYELAGALWSAHQYEDALSLRRAVVDRMEVLHPERDHMDLATSYSQVAYCLQEMERSEEALGWYERSLEVRERIHPGPHPTKIGPESGIGNCLLSLGRTEEAVVHLAYCRTYAIEAGSSEAEIATHCNNLGLCLNRLARFDEAIPVLEEAVRRTREAPGVAPGHVAIALANLAGCLKAAGRPTEAISTLEQALTAMEADHDEAHPDLIWIHNELGHARVEAGLTEDALDHHQTALAMCRALFTGPNPNLASSLDGVGRCLVNLGHPVAALPHYEEALAMRGRWEPRSTGTVQTLTGMAQCLLALGRPAEALTRFEAAWDIVEDHQPEHASLRRLGLNNLAYGLNRIGRSGEAAEMYAEVVRLTARAVPGDHVDNATARSNLATTKMAAADHAGALADLEEIAAMQARLFEGDHPGLARTHHLAAAALLGLDRTEEALPRAREAVEMRRRLGDRDYPEGPIHLNGVATCLSDLGRAEEALELYEQALAMSRRVGTSDVPLIASNQAAELLGLGRLEEARDAYAVAIEGAEELRGRALHLDGSDLAGLFGEARRFSPYRGMIRVQLQLGHPESALDYLERGRGRSLLDILTRADSDPIVELWRAARRDGDGALLEQLDGLTTEIDRQGALVQRSMDEAAQAFQDRTLTLADRRTRIDSARARRDEADRARRRLTRERLQLAESRLRAATPASVDELRAMLNEDELFLYFHLDEEGCYLFLVPESGEVAVERLAAGADQLEDRVEEYLDVVLAEGMRLSRERRAHELPADSDVPALSRALFRSLFPERAWARIASASRVHLVPDGVLHRLPFETLEVSSRDEEAMDGPWIELGPPIAYGFSGSSLLLCRERAAASRRAQPTYEAVVVGAPHFETDASPDPAPVDVARLAHARPPREQGVTLRSDQVLEPLPGTLREAAAIFEALTGEPLDATRVTENEAVYVLTGEDATEANLLKAAAKGRYLHIATHFLADLEGSAGYGSIALCQTGSGSAEEDGFLQTWEVMERWNGQLAGCELVVLSGCHTHGGTLDRDEGVFSIPWAFMYAGAPSVIASQWVLEDDSTAELMGSFYSALGRKDAPGTLDSFVRARRDFRGRYPHPFFWGPYVFLGSP